MSRYIDAYKIPYHDLSDGKGLCQVAFLEDIAKVPTADVRENVRAERLLSGQTTSKYDIEITNWFECSACGGAVDEYDNFCKHCGADMRGGDAK